ncbi:hypothetical protein KAW38_02610 [Candidatus Micrarchaeota archaeon]|nr:hypothetical protein [Candidatus Micrarchaeota archaeon]
MKKLFFIFLVFLLVSAVSATALELAECYVQCQEEYDSYVSEAERMASQGLYTEHLTYGGTCPRVSTYGGSGPYSNIAKCVAVQQICIAEGSADCQALLQTCCLEEAKLTASKTFSNCNANCDYNYPGDVPDTVPEEDLYEGFCKNCCIGDTYYYNGEYSPEVGMCAYSGTQQCQYGCSDELGCLEEAPASDKCEAVYCPEYYCEYSTYYYDGYCDSSDGQCYYYSFECDYGCDPATNQCKQPEVNTLAPNVEVSISPSSVVLKDGLNAADILITVIGSDGPVSGAKVHIRVTDPEFTGVLGSWGFVDVVRYTDASGTTSGKLTLPEITKIKSIYWDEFPCTLEIQVTVSKHDELEDWSVQESSSLGVSSPAPKITDVRIEPSPALAFYTHNVFITIEDMDSTEFTYLVRNYGGKWKAHSNALAGVNEKVYAFSSTQLNELIQWESPARGLSEDEVIMARAMAGNLEGLAINLALTGTEEASKKLALKYAGKTFGKYAGNFVPIVNTGKSLYGLYGNVKNLGDDVLGITESQSFKEGAYKSMDFVLEGGKTTIGVVTLAGKQVPIIGGLAGLTQDMIDALVGTMQAKLNDLAGSERIRNAEALTADYAFSIVVKDSDGFRDEYFYEYQMEYLGFKEG